MAYQWKNTIVLITGAAKGIGSCVCRILLAEEGVKQIVIVDIDEVNGIALKNELNAKHGSDKVKFIKCDVTNEQQLLSTFEEVLGDKTNEYAVINGAGILNDSWETYRKEIDINVKALITGSLKALDLMRKDKGGKGGTIINISSALGLMVSSMCPIYSATKGAVMQFSTGIGHDDYYLRTGVRVLAICFGGTDTGLLALNNTGNFDPEIQERWYEIIVKNPGQKIESAARGLVDCYKSGKSATVWLSNYNKPVEDITPAYTQAYQILSATFST